MCKGCESKRKQMIEFPILENNNEERIEKDKPNQNSRKKVLTT